MFRCDVCRRFYPTKEKLRLHINTHIVKINPYKCKVCRRAFAHKSLCLAHEKAHGPKPFSCPDCLKSYSTKYNLIKHRRELHNMDGPHMCEHCGMGFKFKYLQREHEQKHGATLSEYRCGRCKAAFLLKIDRDNHSKKCIAEIYNLKVDQKYGERLFVYGQKCRYCDFVTNQNAELVAHEKTHEEDQLNDEPPVRLVLVSDPAKPVHKCRFCPFSSTETAQLLDHEETHLRGDQQTSQPNRGIDMAVVKNLLEPETHKAPSTSLTITVKQEFESQPTYTNSEFRCGMCFNVFASKDQLLEHNRRFHKRGVDDDDHTARLIYCAICLSPFLSQDQLRSHQDSAHGNIQPRWSDNLKVSCTLCSKSFPSGHELKKHLGSQHNKDKTGNSLQSTTEVATTKLIYCAVCMSPFLNHDQLREHHTSAHSDANIQPDSAKSNRKFPCPCCTKSFYSKYTLKRHQTRKHDKDTSENISLQSTEATTKLIYCAVCMQPFLSQDKLRDHHASVHSGSHVNVQPPRTDPGKSKRKFPCTICPKSFSSKYILKKHLERPHKDKSYIIPQSAAATANLIYCAVCMSPFLNQGQLRAHHASAHGNINNIQMLKNHQGRQHIDDKSGIISQPAEATTNLIYCAVCLQLFLSQDELRLHHASAHSESDVNVQKFPCPLCVKSFSSKYILKKHLGTHHKDKRGIIPQSAEAATNFIYCAVCMEPFLSQDQLGTHNASAHSDVTCPLCLKSFSSAYELKRHQGNLHRKDKTGHLAQSTEPTTKLIYCAVCMQPFLSQDQLRSHHASAHSDINIQPRRTDLAYQPDSMAKGGSRMIRCVFCSMSFPSALKLAEHQEQQHGNDEDVNFAESDEAASETSMSTEPSEATNFFQFRCAVCPKAYMNNRALMKHQASHDEENEENADNNAHPPVVVVVDSHKHHQTEETEENLGTSSTPVFDASKHQGPTPEKFKSPLWKSLPQTSEQKIIMLDQKQQLDGPIPENSRSPLPKSLQQNASLTKRKYTTIKTDDFVIQMNFGRRGRPKGCKRGEYFCNYCQKVFKTRRGRISHEQVHSREPVKCHICGKEFVFPRSLQKHILAHSPHEQFQCSKCDFQTAYKIYLSKHMLYKHGIGAAYCDICKKPFLQKFSLPTHLKRHCRFCGYFVPQSSGSVKNHEDEHLSVVDDLIKAYESDKVSRPVIADGSDLKCQLDAVAKEPIPETGIFFNLQERLRATQEDSLPEAKPIPSEQDQIDDDDVDIKPNIAELEAALKQGTSSSIQESPMPNGNHQPSDSAYVHYLEAVSASNHLLMSGAEIDVPIHHQSLIQAGERRIQQNFSSEPVELPLFHCDVCSLPFLTKEELITHQYTKHPLRVSEPDPLMVTVKPIVNALSLLKPLLDDDDEDDAMADDDEQLYDYASDPRLNSSAASLHTIQFS